MQSDAKHMSFASLPLVSLVYKPGYAEHNIESFEAPNGLPSAPGLDASLKLAVNVELSCGSHL